MKLAAWFVAALLAAGCSKSTSESPASEAPAASAPAADASATIADTASADTPATTDGSPAPDRPTSPAGSDAGPATAATVPNAKLLAVAPRDGVDRKGGGPVGEARPRHRKVAIALRVDVVSSGLEKADAQRVLASRRNVFQACYTRALRDRPTLSGGIRAQIAIDAAGQVKQVKLTRRLDDRVDSCVQRQMMRVAFPPTKQPERVRALLIFRSA